MRHFDLGTWAAATDTDTYDGRLYTGSDGVSILRWDTIMFEEGNTRFFFNMSNILSDPAWNIYVILSAVAASWRLSKYIILVNNLNKVFFEGAPPVNG